MLSMIAVGTEAPDFTLLDQFSRPFHLADSRGRANVLLLFYPPDWTPTRSSEVPALEARVDRFAEEAHTQVAGISIDSRPCHASWGRGPGRRVGPAPG